MHCDTVRAALLDYSNAETGPVRAWAIRRHLADCAGCAQELAAQRQFTATLRRADLVPPMSAPVAVPARRMPMRRAFAGMAAVLLVIGLLLLPTLYQSRRNAQNPGAAIAAALGRVNTCHFSGWKLIDGKQVPWEVWGRRAPWLYYERVGDTTTWTDGKQRLRVFAPDPALKRPHGLVVRTSMDEATGDLGFFGDMAYQSLFNSQGAQATFKNGEAKLYAQTDAVARFRDQTGFGAAGVNENKLYAVSKRDWLPTTYQLHFDNPKFARDTEYLSVRYDVDLPDAVISPPFPSGYSLVDSKQSAAGRQGFRVQVEPAGIDKQGNLMIVARGWFGGNRLLQGTTFTLNVSPFNGAAYGAAFGQRRGRKIKYLYASNFSVPPGDDIYLPYVPIEPSQVATSLPDTFDFPLAASLQVLARSSDQVDASGDTHPATRTETLFTEELHPRLPLSKPVQTLAAALPTPRDLYDQRRVYYNLSYDFQGTFYEKVLPLTVQRKFRDPDGTLNYYRVNAALSTEQIEALRSKHATEYRRLEQGFRRRAAYWQERKIAALRGPQDLPPYQKGVPINYLRWDDRFLLAKLYQTAGDEVSMRRVLRQLTADTRNQPSVKGLYHQAEYMLRTGQYPTDAGYKGPS